MGKVVPFRLAPSFECRTVTMAEVTQEPCPRCDDSGWIVFRRRSDGEPDFVRCPCGGTDESRINLDGPDFGGAA
jgi:hypothetical protein